MGVRYVIAGVSLCEKFAQMTFVADHISQNLSNFHYERIEKSMVDWENWLHKLNKNNNWHHVESPIVWKELIMKGSKPYYIGGLPEFLDYCHSYYEFDYFVANKKFKDLPENSKQYSTKVKQDEKDVESTRLDKDNKVKNDFNVCISGSGFELTTFLISQLLELSAGERSIANIYLYDSEFSNRKVFQETLQSIEHDCSYIETDYHGKVIKYVEKIGAALSKCDLFIIMDHVPFQMDMPIGDWLKANKDLMQEIALMLNASAPRDLRILLPNLGPACYNATMLMKFSNLTKSNIVVATSDLGLEVTPIAAEIAGIPSRSMFCPPVWGFVGINHLVDIRTTVHKYNAFEPYRRYTRVRNSTLNVGFLTPEMRTMEYLMYFDTSLWMKVAETRKQAVASELPINKAVSLANVAKLWLFGPHPDDIVSMGIKCNGSFGLKFDGVFSQPARYVNDVWVPADNYPLPRDPEVKLSYLDEMANYCVNIKPNELPKIITYTPYCVCRCKYKPNKKVSVI